MAGTENKRKRTKGPESEPTTNGIPLSQVARIQALSELVTRTQIGHRLGLSYEGKRDIYSSLGYPKEDPTFADYWQRYQRQDIARAVIDRPIEATWHDVIAVRTVASDDETDKLVQAWKEMDKKLKLKEKFSQLDKLASLGHYAVMLIGFDDVSDRQKFAEPVSEGERKIKYVKPISEANAAVESYEERPDNERYGLPKFYKIQLTKPGSKKTYSLRVHYSRILHVAYGTLENEVKGQPVLKSIYNRLIDLEKLVGGSAEMFWRGARPGYQGQIDPEHIMGEKEEEKLRSQIDEYEHDLRRILVSQGIELNPLGAQVSDPEKHVDVQVEMISAVTGIPKRILMGSERGELSSAQDQGAWKEIVISRRVERAERKILSPFVDMCMKYKVLETVDDWVIDWADLFAPSEKDRVEIGRMRAQAIQFYATQPFAMEIFPPEVFMRHILGMTENQVDQIKGKIGEAISLEDDFQRVINDDE